METRSKWSDWKKRFLGCEGSARVAVLDLLGHRYVREKQQAMRYRQHAERMRYPQFRDTLFALAAEEENHAQELAEKIAALGEKPPEVIPIHVAREPNSWFYLRTDLEEEERCAGELKTELPTLSEAFSDVAELLERIEIAGKSHRTKVRAMLARSDPQAAGQQ